MQIELDTVCHNCGGYKQPANDEGYLAPCQKCGGRGFVLTESGEELLAFLGRWAERIGGK